MNTLFQYADYVKPDWAPPAWVFGPVWTALYLIMAISFGYVYYQHKEGKIDFHLTIPFTLNIVFNLLYMPLQFGLHNNVLGTLDILLVFGTLVYAMLNIWKKYAWVSIVNIPYLFWVAFATGLQVAITYLNF